MIPRITIVVCLLAALTEAILNCVSTSMLSPMDAIIVLLMVGPYLVLALLAWRRRDNSAVSKAFFVLALFFAAVGLYVSGVDSYRYHTEPHYRLVQRMTIFIVPLAQWAVVLPATLVSLTQRNCTRC